MSNFLQILSYPFAMRAIIAGVFTALCSSLLGVNLVLKRFSMLGDGLSHVSFGAAAIGLAAGIAPLKISIPIVIVAAFFLLKMNESSKLKGDAAIAIVSSSALGIGIAVASMTTGLNTDINNFMFGSILAIGRNDTYTAVAVAVAVIAVFIVFYQKIFSCTFDESFAFASGVKVKLYNAVTAILTAVTVVVGMRLMGALLISSIMTFPALSAMRLCKRYKTTLILSAVISVVSFLSGLAVSFAVDSPVGASVVIVNLIVFIIALLIERIRLR